MYKEIVFTIFCFEKKLYIPSFPVFQKDELQILFTSNTEIENWFLKAFQGESKKEVL